MKTSLVLTRLPLAFALGALMAVGHTAAATVTHQVAVVAADGPDTMQPGMDPNMGGEHPMDPNMSDGMEPTMGGDPKMDPNMGGGMEPNMGGDPKMDPNMSGGDGGM